MFGHEGSNPPSVIPGPGPVTLGQLRVGGAGCLGEGFDPREELEGGGKGGDGTQNFVYGPIRFSEW